MRQNDNRRTAYRRLQTQAHRLTICVRAPNGEIHPGTFQDLSIGGACATFAIHDKVLLSGQVVLLTIGSLTRSEKVVAKARVMFARPGPGGRLCGFQFTEPLSVQQQIDGFYARFFNRRKSQRVGMPLDKKVFVQVFHEGVELKTELLDLSVEGMQVRGPRAKAKELAGTNHVSLRFQLPGRTEELSGKAAILRRSEVRDHMILGLAFDLTQEGGLSKSAHVLRSWVVHRANEILKWDSSLAKPDAGPKPATPAPANPWGTDSTLPRRLG